MAESPTGVKALIRTLFKEEGVAYTVEEICEKTGKGRSNVTTALSDLKSDKYCGPGGKIILCRRNDGRYYCVSNDGIQEVLEEENSEETSFAYENDLRNYLSNNLSIIESGLKLYKEDGIDGVEYSVDANNKRIDILAIDKNKIPVVIELKVSRGYERVIGQCLYYKNKVKQILNSPKVRIIIISREITEQLKTATEDLPDVELFEYKLSVKLEKINGKK